MTKRELKRAALLVAVVALAACSRFKSAVEPDRTKSTYQHMFGERCPLGLVPMPGFFIERTGEKLPACYNGLGDGSIDVLMPGEGVDVEIIQPPPAAKGRKL